MKNCEFKADMTVSESVKEHVSHWPMPQGNVPIWALNSFAVESCVPMYPGYFCYAKKRLGGYWRKWKMSRDHFAKYENS